MPRSLTSLVILLLAHGMVLAQPPFPPAGIPTPTAPGRPGKQLAPEKILRLLGADGKTGQEENYRRLFRFLDADRNDYLSWEEYVVRGRYGNPTVRGRIFHITDKDGDDSISIAEYLHNRHVTDEAKELVGLADENRDGSISREEFLQHPRIKKAKTAGRVFDMLDRNRDGWLYSTEYLFTWQAWMNSLPSGWNRDGNASPKPAGKETRRSKNTSRGKSWSCSAVGSGQ